MTIAILPARLANQIAAGEVVERPASVIKELIENSLDSGATAINIDIDKGGIKKIKITDNGSGILKDELALALSRHATSKIKNLDDLEAIHSLGFRGEALASISSVARLTLTSKPKAQDAAWQAIAQGRDMEVEIKPAAHPDGTSIEVLDLFFNTPARRKFLRTEKTEFTHIDEVIKRIALAHFEVSFTLTHNGKVIRQYRVATTQAQFNKRVAMVCGPKFIEHAIEIDCPHDSMKLSGWLAKPSFSRSQNDLCYSYVNGRMMRDKLINHAIRQAYADLLPNDTYPAFVLFLALDYREVDVNVHPAKHEVRFHQSRYVHDFIYSVCHKALISDNQLALTENSLFPSENVEQTSVNQSKPLIETAQESVNYPPVDYITQLQRVSDVSGDATAGNSRNWQNRNSGSISPLAAKNYQKLMTPIEPPLASIPDHTEALASPSTESRGYIVGDSFFITVTEPGFGLYKTDDELRVLSVFKLAQQINRLVVTQSWQQENNTALVTQPLLLPIMLTLTKEQAELAKQQLSMIHHAGINIVLKDNNKVQVRQFPALLREQDVSQCLITLLDFLLSKKNQDVNTSLNEQDYIQAIAHALVLTEYSQEQSETVVIQAKKLLKEKFNTALALNSVALDLTSHIKRLV